MGRIRERMEVGGLASDAERLWYDHRRWPTFVDGLKTVTRVEGDWPRRGSRVVWDSDHPEAGRVLLNVEAYEPREGQTTAIEDDRIRGTRRVLFTPHEAGVTVTLELAYEPKDPRLRPGPIDRLFVRRGQREALRRTLRRFAAELRSERDPAL